MAQLTKEQRYTISVMYGKGYSQTSIAEAIGKERSVICRELKRNRDEHGNYTFSTAQMLCDIRKERLTKKRKFTPEVQNRIERYMRQKQWSPEQIVGYSSLKGYAMVSVERIYQYIREDKAEGGDLYKHCRHALKHRKRPVGKHIPIKDRVSIELRPPEADGKNFGDWEMDTIVGKDGKGAMLTLVERSLGYAIIATLPNGKNAEDVAKTVYRELLPFKGHIRTITTDNGTEFAEHKMIAKLLDTTVYFTHTYCSWEKGVIEYTNKLIRQYIPKKSEFNKYTEHMVKEIQYLINARPRKKLGFNTPVKIFYANLQT